VLVYTCGVLTNAGNYKGFGDSKMVPNVSAEKFEALVMASNAYKKDSEKVKFLWDKIKKDLYSIDTKQRSLGLGEKVKF
jgi:dipeptidyl-peptidase III